MCLICPLTAEFEDKEDAIKAWNRRKPIDRIVGQLEELFDKWGLDKGKKDIMCEIVKGEVAE